MKNLLLWVLGVRCSLNPRGTSLYREPIGKSIKKEKPPINFGGFLTGPIGDHFDDGRTIRGAPLPGAFVNFGSFFVSQPAGAEGGVKSTGFN